MLQAPDPTPFLRSFAKSLRRLPNGNHFAAANAATILALYGRTEEAERELEAVQWEDVPPLIQAQASAARAVIAYVNGAITEGLDHAVAATQQGAVDSSAPGASTAELAFRTYRNLGLALAGRTMDATAEELRTALAKLPLVGQILAAWGLAAIARAEGNDAELAAMRSFLAQHAPHARLGLNP